MALHGLTAIEQTQTESDVRTEQLQCITFGGINEAQLQRTAASAAPVLQPPCRVAAEHGSGRRQLRRRGRQLHRLPGVHALENLALQRQALRQQAGMELFVAWICLRAEMSVQKLDCSGRSSESNSCPGSLPFNTSRFSDCVNEDLHFYSDLISVAGDHIGSKVRTSIFCEQATLLEGLAGNEAALGRHS